MSKKLLCVTIVLCATNIVSGDINGSCEKPNADEAPTLVLPGSHEDWLKMGHSLRALMRQIKGTMKDVGLGKFLADMAVKFGLPGSKKEWKKKFADYTLESTQEAWNGVMEDIWNGKGWLYRTAYHKHILVKG